MELEGEKEGALSTLLKWVLKVPFSVSSCAWSTVRVESTSDNREVIRGHLPRSGDPLRRDLDRTAPHGDVRLPMLLRSSVGRDAGTIRSLLDRNSHRIADPEE